MKYSLIAVFVTLIVTLPVASYAESNSATTEKRESEKTEKDNNDLAEVEAEEIQEIMVTATRTETPISQLPDSVTLISRERMEQQKARTVFETLRSVPGLTINKSGGIGRLTTVRLRGSSAKHVLVMIDGVQVNSPTTGSFDFANLTTDNLESIEIVRGAQSTLYGSDAMGGVINIITKKGKGKPGFSIRSEFGTPERTFNESISSSGSIGNFNYSTDMARTDSDGRGSNDDYDKWNGSARLGYKINEKLNFDMSSRYNRSKVGIDDGPFRNDPNNTSKNKDFVLNTIFNQTLITNWWSHKLKFSFADSNMVSKDKTNPGGPDPFGAFRFHLDTQIYTGDWQHTLNYKDINTLLIGFEFEEQKADNRTFDETIINRGWYFQNQLKLWDRLFFNAGVRVDDNNRFGKDTNPKFSFAYHLKETGTKFKANYGKGFRGPTLNELFFPNFGDPTLQPEESENYDIGLEQYLLADKVFFGVTYFKNRFSNLIQSVNTGGFVFRAQNIGKVRTEGVEAEALIRPFEGLTLRGTFTRTSTRDELKKQLIRQPRTQGSVNINYRFLEKFNLNIDDTIVGGSRDGRNGGGISIPGRPGIRRTNSGYHKLDVAFSCDFTKHIEMYTRIENIVNKKYYEVLGFRAPGARFFFGAKISF